MLKSVGNWYGADGLQTFMPFADFAKSAAALDWRRLGKQRAEVIDVLNVITKGPMKNQPIYKMWRAHVNCLVAYGVAICQEWRERGYNDECLEKIQAYAISDGSWNPPRWLGDERLHSNHRGRLLEKDPSWYGQFGWKELPVEKNFWPLEGLL